MHHDAVYLCTAIFALLGVRLGWSFRLGLLFYAAAAASLSALLFVPDDAGHFIAKVAIVAIIFDVAVQSGFIFGVLTRNDTKLD